MGFEWRVYQDQNRKSFLLFISSFFIVAFGQPAYSSALGLLAALLGYALFWEALDPYAEGKKRFSVSFMWFFLVQLTQLSWLLSHPYWYIFLPWLFFSSLWAVQFALLFSLLRKERAKDLKFIFGCCGAWTLFEWSRLFVLSGFSWNPVGMALTGSLYSLQLASLCGIFGLSFWVMWVNLLGFRAFTLWEKKAAFLWLGCAILPYLYGGLHVAYHKKQMAEHKEAPFLATLVQPSFQLEENLSFSSQQEFVDFVLGEWSYLFSLLSDRSGQKSELIVLPEFVVPFTAWSFAYPYEKAVHLIEQVLGEEGKRALPKKALPFVAFDGNIERVNNAFFSQVLANFHHTGVVIGLEDAAEKDEKKHLFTSAFYFLPHEEPQVYYKRILVPMGEYIPFEFFKQFAQRYGVMGSFSPGDEAKVFTSGCRIPFGTSICYEETFGHLTRENKQLGARLLVNVTSDSWFPNSRLPKQHLDHAILRTTEAGIPLVRACNTGITCAINSLGEVVAMLGEEGEDQESLSAAFDVSVSTYTYETPYSFWGDSLVIYLSLIALLWNFFSYGLSFKY